MILAEFIWQLTDKKVDNQLLLREIKEPDNEEYTYEDPGDGYDSMKEDCSHCHTGFVLDFLLI